MSLTATQKQVADWVLSKVGDTVAGKAIEVLLAYCIEQDAKLDQLMADVKKIKGERYKSGFKFLADAMHARDQKLQRELINDARKAFTQATELEEGVTSVRAAYQVGLCYQMLAEPENAIRWYEKAFQISDSKWDAAFNRLFSLVDTGDQSDVRSIGLILLTFTVIGAPLALHISQRVRREKEQLENVLRDLDNFIPHLKRHLEALNPRLSVLGNCERRHMSHEPRDEYRSFTQSSDNRYGLGH